MLAENNESVLLSLGLAHQGEEERVRRQGQSPTYGWEGVCVTRGQELAAPAACIALPSAVTGASRTAENTDSLGADLKRKRMDTSISPRDFHHTKHFI